MFSRGWTLTTLTRCRTVTVVHPTRNECVYHGCGSIFHEWLLHGIHLPQMVKTLARQASDMGCEVHRTVEQYAEAHCFSVIMSRDRWDIKLQSYAIANYHKLSALLFLNFLKQFSVLLNVLLVQDISSKQCALIIVAKLSNHVWDWFEAPGNNWQLSRILDWKFWVNCVQRLMLSVLCVQEMNDWSIVINNNDVRQRQVLSIV